MKIKIVPSTRDGRHQLMTTYVINETLAIDAGALAVGLTRAEQLRLRSIIITHTHLDHIATLPLYITELFDDLREPVKLFATASDFDALCNHIFNARIWIPFEILRNAHTELIAHHPYKSGQPFETEGLRITPIPVTHTVLTHGLLIEDERDALLFTSDTGETERIWQAANDCQKLRAVFIDVSFPIELTGLARASLHHSTETLVAEATKIKAGVPIYAIHLKPTHRDRVSAEINALGDQRLRVAEIGLEYEFAGGH